MKSNRPLRVMHVVVGLGLAGMEKVIVDGLKRFDRKKIISSVCCIIARGSLADKLEESGIRVFELGNGISVLDRIISLKLMKLFKQEKIDIVHSYSGVYRDACMGAKLAGIPINIHTDQGKFYPDTQWTRWNHRFFSLFRDKVVTVSEELKDFLIDEVGIRPGKIMINYNGVDIKDHELGIDPLKKRQELGLDGGRLVIGIVARLVPVKDHKTLFLSAKMVFESVPEGVLLVIGDGPLRGDLEDFSQKLGISEKIKFLGLRKDVAELMTICDLFVLSSLSEGTSLTLLEAMATGKPVVATNVGGNPELVEDGVTGLLVPPKNPEKLAEAIIEVLNDKGKRETMGKAGRNRVATHFSIEKMVEGYENLYFDLAREKGILE